MPVDISHNLLMGGRSDFARLCDVKGLKTAVEIGTDRGCFAREFLDKWHGEMLYCVDPYSRYNEMPWDRQGDLLLAVAHLAIHAQRVRFILEESKMAAELFRKGEPLPTEVGFVYIDGAHDLVTVRSDLITWFPLVKPGGIMAGDDYQIPSVREAVIDFAARTGHTVALVSDYNRATNWMIEKS